MQKYLLKIISIFIILVISAYMTAISSVAEETDQDKSADKKTEAPAPKISYLEKVSFEKLSGKERINLIVSHQPVIKVEGQTNGSLLVKLENTSAPENLQRQLGEGELNNILRVTPSQQLAEGKQWIYLTIDIKEIVPYAIKQEGQNILIDFNTSTLAEKKPPVSPIVKDKTPEVTVKKKAPVKATVETAKSGSDDAVESEAIKVKPVKKEIISKYGKDRIISIDFQDATIQSVLRLMAEAGNTSIVSGDDVKGNVTLTMRNVPWEQALDAILDVNGLTKKQMGDVISIMTLERKKKDESDKKQAEKDQREAEDVRKARDLKILVEKGKLKQILIEAKIVEASEDFVRNLGIQWGFTGAQSIGSYGSRISGGTSTLQTNAWRYAYPPEIALQSPSTSTPFFMSAVNLPAALASPTFGIVFGAGSAFIEAQLAALESTTSGRVISAPKVVTMDDVKATIKQGDEIPYITQTVTAQGITTTVTFKEAVLKLEVKPKVTDDGRISMQIKAGNEVADYALAEKLFGNPPIHKNEVESNVVIQDGDTVVIGGVSREQDQTIINAIPWFYKIPVLGWLFKTEGINKSKKQLLVFITPKVLKSDSFTESAEKIIN